MGISRVSIRPAARFALALFCLALASGCLGNLNPFGRDPLTGGVDRRESALLDITFPPGLQIYPSHGYIERDSKNGLETLRGHVNPQSAALTFFNSLTANGWSLKIRPRKGDRAVYVYQREQRYAVLTFHKQGALTIVEIWTGNALPEGAPFSAPPQPVVSEDALQGEEYGPIQTMPSVPESEEKFGSPLEERSL